MPQYHKVESRAQLAEILQIREARLDTSPSPKRARFSKMVRSSSMNNLTGKRGDNHDKDHQSSPTPSLNGLEEYRSTESSVKESLSLIPYQSTKQILDAAAESVRQLAASLPSNDEDQLGRSSPNGSNPSKPFNFDLYDPKVEFSPGLWLKTLGLLPLERPLRVHKNIPTNHTKLKRFQQVC